MDVPAVVDVKGLFRWASDGDIALLDGDHGLFVINPSKSEMASLREDRRSAQEANEAHEGHGPGRSRRSERRSGARVTMR